MADSSKIAILKIGPKLPNIRLLFNKAHSQDVLRITQSGHTSLAIYEMRIETFC